MNWSWVWYTRFWAIEQQQPAAEGKEKKSAHLSFVLAAELATCPTRHMSRVHMWALICPSHVLLRHSGKKTSISKQGTKICCWEIGNAATKSWLIFDQLNIFICSMYKKIKHEHENKLDQFHFVFVVSLALVPDICEHCCNVFSDLAHYFIFGLKGFGQFFFFLKKKQNKTHFLATGWKA